MPLIFGLIFLSFPIFYCYGLYAFFSDASKKVPSRLEAIYKALIECISKETDKARYDYLVKSAALVEKAMGYVNSEAPQAMSSSSTAETSNLQIDPAQISVETASSPQYHVTSSPQHALNISLLQDSNVLLYLGAFLLLISASIFVGFSYETFSGLTKTLLVAFVAIVFYAAGLGLFTQTKKFQPAGMTFTAIGLLLMPLTGLAAYTYIFQHTFGELTWFMTSLALCVFYWIAFHVIRKSFLAYLSIFTVVSLVASIVSLFTVPLYYIGWTGIILAAALLVIKKHAHPDELLEEPIAITTYLLLPLSMALSLYLIPVEGYFQFTVQSLLAAAFCSVFISLANNRQERQFGIWGVLGLLPVALVSGLRAYHGGFELTTMNWGLSLLGLGYLVVREGLAVLETSSQTSKEAREFFGEWKDVLINMGTMLLIISPLLVTENSGALWRSVWILAIAMAWLTWRTREVMMYSICLAATFVLPFIGVHYFELKNEELVISSSHLGIAAGLTIWRWIQEKLDDNNLEKFSNPTIIAYLCSLCASFGLMALTPLSFWSIGICVVLIFLTAVLTTLEDIPEGLIATGVLWIFTLMKFVELNHLPMQVTILCLFMSGIIWYIAGIISLQLSIRKRNILQLIGVFMLTIGAAWRFVLSEPSWMSIACLAAISAIILAESWRVKNRSGIRLGAGIFLVAVQWVGWDFASIREVLFYSISWSAYFAIIAMDIAHWVFQEQLNATSETESDGWILLSLAALTIPLAIQGLDDPKRGLLLIGIDVVLIGLGLLSRRKLIWKWAATLLVLQVLYYMRDFLLGIPTWAIFGGIGLLMLSAALWMLSRQREIK